MTDSEGRTITIEEAVHRTFMDLVDAFHNDPDEFGNLLDFMCEHDFNVIPAPKER